MVHLDQTEMIIMCKHQMGNYIIQIVINNASHTEPGRCLIKRILLIVESIMTQRHGCRVI